MPAPKTGDLRVTNTIHFHIVNHWPVNHLTHAINLIDALAYSQLLDDKITDNIFDLEELTSEGWESWESADGDSVSDLTKDWPVSENG